MSRPSKRNRQELDCYGHCCGKPECISCVPSEAVTTRFPHHASVTPGASGQYGHLPPPTTLPPPSAVANANLNYAYMISQLDDNTIRFILSRLATVSAQAQEAISSSYQQQQRMLRECVIDFNEYAVQAWHILNTSAYTEGRGSKQYEAAFAASSDIVECITEIGNATRPESSCGTKLSALEALHEIAQAILLAGDTLGHQVRLEFQHEHCLADIMVGIVRSMTPEEQRWAGASTDEDGSLVNKLAWVCDKADAHVLEGLSGLREALDLLTGTPNSVAEPEPGGESSAGV